MATTLNYGWTKPTPGGDVGAWGTILNTLFDAVDAGVKVVADAAAAALAAANVAKANIDEFEWYYPSALGFVEAQSNTDSFQVNALLTETNGMLIGRALSSVDSGTFIVPLPNLKTGHRITGFKVKDNGTGPGITTTAQLFKRSTSTGTSAAIGTSVTLHQNTLSSPQESSITGLSEDVVISNVYFIKIVFTRASGTHQTRLYYVTPIVTRP